MFKVGAARCAITPPIGMTMAGYAAREGVAMDKDGELYATSLVLDDGRTRIAVVTLDLLFLQEPLISALREEVGRRIGVPRSNILLNFSHTHSGPTSEKLQYDDDEHQHHLRMAYSARLQTDIPALVALAAIRLRPARIGAGSGEARIGINRRERQPDGSIMLGENPAGPVDHEVRVIRIDDLQGKPIAVVFAHGCHTVTMGPKSLRWSSDYVGPARDLIEQNTGGLALFLQATAGDINPATGIGDTEDNSAEKIRLGVTLGAEVLKVHASIYTESIRGERTLVGSLAKIPYYPRVPISKEPSQMIHAREEVLSLPLQALPSLDAARAILEKWESEVSRLTHEKVSGAPMNVARHFRHWAIALQSHLTQGLKPAVQIPVQALCVGDIAIVAVPGETFSMMGLDVKRQSPFSHTLFLGYSNGCVSYIPTADAYPKTGWRVTERYYVPDMIFQAYLLPTALSTDCSERIISKSLDLLAALHS